MRFNRNYRVLIEIDGKEVEILPPLRIAFSCSKSNFGQMNTCNVKIYNLSKGKRARLMFEPENRKYARFSLFVGYEDSTIGIFKGSIKRASSERAGADYITTLESIDGGADYINSYTSKAVSNGDVVASLVDDMKNTKMGTNAVITALSRPAVLVGNSARLIEERLGQNESIYIDDEVLHVTNNESYRKGRVHLVSAKTGLMSAPKMANQQIEFETMMNPLLKIGHLCQIESTVNPSVDGAYRVDTIVYTGDSHGANWSQSCKARASSAMVAV